MIVSRQLVENFNLIFIQFYYLYYRNAYEVQALKDSLMEIKEGLHPKNLSKFENDVEVHMQHIQTGLSQMGNLRVFMMNGSTNNATNGGSSSNQVKVVPTVRVKQESK